ncbi:pre-60S ribosomal particles component [Scheffersomyces spartinae]|uniref:Pre-60S ribosomal particles component n=1 Tax=Scheffersomyces spartinae TaxID=45513 RepID=A0A9P7VCA1_9ASCO|nr:pre-60S ribosomal particles component [Scheffersomyces spartinae]KAG7195334.1 pre-60S ribosomal particles component [Scheffersomyces spartinae]
MAQSRSNREILTGGKKYVQKQANKHRVEEVVFDKDSRKEYLTGFHKRKVQRQKKAAEYHKEQERLARIEQRKEIREERKKDFELQLALFNKTMKDIGDDDEGEDDENDSLNEWDGFGGSDDEYEHNDNKVLTLLEKKLRGILQHKEIYSAGDDNATNALVEDETEVVVESLENPIFANNALEDKAVANNVHLEKSEKVLEQSILRAKKYAISLGVAEPSFKDKMNKKKKKFRYLTKGERRQNLRKEKLKKYRRD